MATSPIYSWPEPDNTDLVKNGALAIRTLGNAIDTTMGTMVAKTIIDAKGDLIAGSAADTALRLAVGSNGETLVADSSTSTGLRYQGSMAAGKNVAINGGMDIWQRGTSFALASNTLTFAADRWQGKVTGTVTNTYSRVATNDTTNLPFIQYALRIQRTSGQTATPVFVLAQNVETINAIPYAGKAVTMSFYARRGANFSSASNVLTAELYSGTGTDQNIYGTWTGLATPISQNVTLTTTWQRFTLTGTVASTATELAIYFAHTPSGTAGADDWYEITGVQLEIGSVATNFTRTGGSIQGELAACQRYYFRASANAVYSQFAQGHATSTTQGWTNLVTPVSMRIVPTTLDYSTVALSDGVNGYTAVTSMTIGSSDSSASFVTLVPVVSSGLTQYRPYKLAASNSASAYVGVSAEL